MKNWQVIFGYLSSDYRSWPSDLQAEKQVITLRVDASGTTVRLVLENEYGIESLDFSSVTLTHQGQDYSVQVLRQAAISVRVGERLWTDPIALDFKAGDTFVITTQLAHPTTVTSGIVTYSNQEMQVENVYQGNFEPQEKRFRTKQENAMLNFVYGFQYLTAVTTAKTVHFFGDSLTQQGWLMDGLKQRLRDEKLSEFGIVNLGIGGNLILSGTDRPQSDPYFRHGYAGLVRFERDVFSLNVPDTVLLFHGINDCLFGDKTADQIIAGLTTYLATIKRYGSRAVGCTLTPAGHSDFYSECSELKRQAVNTWIRESPLYDHVLDLDKIAHIAQTPHILKSSLDRGDGLHYSKAGGHELAQTLPKADLLALFNGENI
ncbi:SGNH hydrolase [Lactococcus hodotermopsidis]|uniref:SGNH hydrolase n=1 Tax=Pseudolactococcus hodotermopsidis TaxID=2709157 RepID=A0A6A0BCH5_9LACT|nr:GDSL-type esterase/lipase family protein [Lactococcus hodotermopsidis]GFH42058.1 SGNH hydrolase [Lactococcus hodotermopsidis]